jgi:TP901 family phage tail tape measure protein
MPSLGRAASYGLYGLGAPSEMAFSIVAIDAATPVFRQVESSMGAFQSRVFAMTEAANAKAMAARGLVDEYGAALKGMPGADAYTARMAKLQEQHAAAQLRYNKALASSKYAAALEDNAGLVRARNQMALAERAMGRVTAQMDKLKASAGLASKEVERLAAAKALAAAEAARWEKVGLRAVTIEMTQGVLPAVRELIKGFATLALIGGGAAIALAIGFATVGANVEAAMHVFAAINQELGWTFETTRKYQNELAALAVRFRSSSDEMARAYVTIAKAGVRGAESQDVFNAALRLSIANQRDMSLAAEDLVKIITAMNMKFTEASRVAEILQYFTNQSIANFEDMAQGFKYAGGLAALLNIDINELGAALAVLSNTGLEASIAGRYMRQAFSDIASDLPGFTAAMKALGVEVKLDANGQLDFVDVLRQLSKVIKENRGDITVLQKMLEGLNIRSATAIIQLAQNFDKFIELVDKSRGPLEDLDLMVKENLESIKSYITGIVEAFRAPFLFRGFTDVARDFFKTFYEELLGKDISTQFGQMILHFLMRIRAMLPEIITLVKMLTSEQSALWGIMDAGLNILRLLVNFLNMLGATGANAVITFTLLSKVFNINYKALFEWSAQVANGIRHARAYGVGLRELARDSKSFRVATINLARGLTMLGGQMFLMGMAARDAGQLLVMLAIQITTILIPAIISALVAETLGAAIRQLGIAGAAVGVALVAGLLGFFYAESERARQWGAGGPGGGNYYINNMNVYTQDAEDFKRKVPDQSGAP